MKDEIKEILEDVKRHLDYVEATKQCSIRDNEIKVMYDYITNLQEELKEYKMLFDAFSERPYAHRYLEEKKKELGNKNIIGLDSEMIYKDYYDLKEKNERLKELCNKYEEEHSTTFEYWKQLIKEDYKSRNEKAIEYIKSFEDIKAYYCYEEYGYDEYNTDDDFKNDLLNILNGDDKYE